MKNLIYYNIGISLCDQTTLRGHFLSIVSMFGEYCENIKRRYSKRRYINGWDKKDKVNGTDKILLKIIKGSAVNLFVESKGEASEARNFRKINMNPEIALF